MVINSGTILSGNNFNFMLFLTLTAFWRSVKFWPTYSKLNLGRFSWHSVCRLSTRLHFLKMSH